MSIDVKGMTLGLFEPRVTTNGAPVSFAMQGMTFVVHRAGSEQHIDAGTRLGAVALIGPERSVLGYGGMDVDDLEGIADAIDAAHGPAIGTPIQRLARHGYTLALPLDAMPDEVRDLFLEEHIPDHILSGTRLDDVSLDAVRALQATHDRAEVTASVEDPGMRQAEIDANVDLIVAIHGHAIIATSSNGPRRTYTIGLAGGGWPELVCLMPDEPALGAIETIISAMRTRDRRPEAGMLIERSDNSVLALTPARPIATAIAPYAARRAQRLGYPVPMVLEVRLHEAARQGGGSTTSNSFH